MNRVPFQYALIRAVPRVERGEFVNVGVVLYCQAREFLGAAVAVDPARVSCLDPGADLAGITVAAEAVVTACTEQVGDARTNTGLATRFGMLTAPRSTVVQPSAVHAGLTTDPAATLDQLMDRLVR